METLATDENIHELFVMLFLWKEIPSISWSWTDKQTNLCSYVLVIFSLMFFVEEVAHAYLI